MRTFTTNSLFAAVAIACSCSIGWAQSSSAPPGAVAPNTASSGMRSESATSSDGAPAKADLTFVTMAALGGMTEVALGKLAASNGQSPSVKSFGKQMVDDHSKANDELAGIAKGKGMSPPSSLDQEHRKLADKFAAMKGDAFDKAYWKQMKIDHQKTIALFEKEASAGKDADIKAFAAKTLPTIRMHLKMVEDAMNGNASKMS